MTTHPDPLPPAYSTSPTNPTSSSSPSDPVPPTTLSLHNRFIYSSDPTTPPLFSLSHAHEHLPDSPGPIRLERLDYAVRLLNHTGSGSDAAPAPVRTARPRHLWDMRHPPGIVGPSFPFLMEAVGRRAGSWGLEPRGRLRGLSLGPGLGLGLGLGLGRRARRWRVWRIVKDGRGDWEGREVGWELERGRGEEVCYWRVRSAEGAEGAAGAGGGEEKVLVGRETAGKGGRQLEVLVEMERKERDCLVGVFCLRYWEERVGMAGGVVPSSSFKSIWSSQ